MFRFKPHYKMANHGSTGNGINYFDGHLDYKKLHMVPNEVVVSFPHLYVYDDPKFIFLTGLTGRPIHNLEDVNFPSPASFNHDRRFILLFHKIPKFACATETAHSLHDFLMYYLQKKD